MSKGLPAAVRLFETFHQFEPREIGEFHAEFRIPAIAMHVGNAVQMLSCSTVRASRAQSPSGV